MTYTATGLRAGVILSIFATVVGLTGCVSTVAGTAVRSQNVGSVNVPPLDEAALDRVMLTLGELNGIIGSTSMKITSELEEMTDHSGEVSDPDCLGVMYGAEEPVYAGTGWTAMRDEIAREPNGDNDHWVEQTAVIYPSAAKAQKFFDDSTTSWQNCAGSSIMVGGDESTYLWEIDDVTAEDDLITQMSTQEDADGWACQHALSVASNLTVEAFACGYSIRDEAATIANEMIANAANR